MENTKVKIMKQYYKTSENSTEIKESLSLKVETLGGYIFARPAKKCYGTLVRLAKENPDMVVEIDKDKPKVFAKEN